MIGNAGFRCHDLDFWARARLGLLLDFRPVFFRGRNPHIDASGARGYPIDVWPAPGDVKTYPFLSAAASLRVVSTSVNDTALGTGARNVFIYGLDSNRSEVTLPVALNGTTPVDFPVQLLRINTVGVLDAGALTSNEGTITVSTVGGTIVSQIAPEDGSSFDGVFSVPLGMRFVVSDVISSIERSSAAAAAEVSLQLRNAIAGGAWFEPLSIALHTQGTTTDVKSTGGAAIEPGYDIRFRCRSVTNNATRLTVAAFGFLYSVAA